MRTALPSFVAAVSALSASLLMAAPARAATPPGDWSLAVERLFGITRTSVDSDLGDRNYTSISLLSKVVGGYGYSAPRFAFDYLIGSGVSFGAALGYNSLGDGDGDAWLIAPRVGYFARPGRSFGLWPRVGLTQLVVEVVTWKCVAAGETTVTMLLTPMYPSATSATRRNCGPTVCGVTLKLPRPAVSAASVGNDAAASLLVKWSVPV